MTEPNLSVNIGGIQMKNPVMTASGTFGYGHEYVDFYDVNHLGAIVVKGLTFEPRLGNKTPRIAETPAGILNSIGLQNPGLEGFIRNEVPDLQKLTVPVIVNISGNTMDEYGEIARRLDDVEGIAGLEVNISCPNVKNGGLAFGTDARVAYEVLSLVRKSTHLPIIAKLSPNVTSITDIARSVEDAGSDAVSLINTLLGMAIDVRTRKPLIGNIMGGLSGPAVKPVALRMVWQVAQTVQIPVVGMGGISCGDDAVEFFLAGATAVAVGTASFINPRAPMDVVEGVAGYMKNQGMLRMNDLIGKIVL
jgi:dihydroorotate dehydrogenase (NAD+) catalytic subunit